MGQDSWYYYMQQINQWIKVSTVQCNSDFFCHISLILGYIFSTICSEPFNLYSTTYSSKYSDYTLTICSCCQPSLRRLIFCFSFGRSKHTSLRVSICKIWKLLFEPLLFPWYRKLRLCLDIGFLYHTIAAPVFSTLHIFGLIVQP